MPKKLWPNQKFLTAFVPALFVVGWSVAYFALIRKAPQWDLTGILGYSETTVCWARALVPWAAAWVMFLGAPAVLLFFKKERLVGSGLSWPKLDLPAVVLTAGGLLAMAASALWASQRPDFQAEYPLCPLAWRDFSACILYYVGYLGYYLAWEFFFRGFIQLHLANVVGKAWAMGLQVAVSTLLHLGKPWPELSGAIPGGIFFGYLAIRTKSVLPAFFLHAWLGLLTDYFVMVFK